MLILESESQTHRSKFLVSRSRVRKDRCGGGGTEQIPIPYNSNITVFQQIFCKGIFWMNFKLQEVHLVAQRAMQKIFFFKWK